MVIVLKYSEKRRNEVEVCKERTTFGQYITLQKYQLDHTIVSLVMLTLNLSTTVYMSMCMHNDETYTGCCPVKVVQ